MEHGSWEVSAGRIPSPISSRRYHNPYVLRTTPYVQVVVVPKLYGT